MLDDLVDNFLSPREFLRKLVGESGVPIGLWVLYVGIAIVGTGLFGFSFGLVYPDVGSPWGWAIVVTVAAGAGWIVLIPIFLGMLGEGRKRMGAMHACLVTMVYGEAILEVGTILNLIGYWRGSLTPEHALVANVTLVAVSNVGMALAICAQMGVLGVKVWKTLLIWMVVLNGVGAGVFWMLYRGVLGG